MRLRESDEHGLEARGTAVSKRAVPLTAVQGYGTAISRRARASKTGKMISRLAQLKNRCLGGERDRQQGGRKQRSHRSPLLSSVSLFFYYLPIRFIYRYLLPIIIDLIISFTGICPYVLCSTDNDSLRTRLLTHISTSCACSDNSTISTQSSQYLIG